MTRDPSQQYKVTSDKKNTLLHYALCSPFDDIALYLLQNGSSADILTANDKGISPYLLTLNGAREKVLELMLELGAHPLSCPFWNENIVPLIEVLAYTGERPTTIQKCLNHLLAAGAGLDISSLPEELFKFYNLQDKKNSLGPLLVLAKQKQPNGICKSRLITQVADMKQYWLHPDWQFKDKQLVLAASCPKLSAPHIKDLQEFLSSQTNLSLPVNEVTKLNALTVGEIENLNTNQLINLVVAHWSVFVEKATLFKSALKQTNLQQKDISRTLEAMENYFKKLSEMMIFLNHPNVSSVIIERDQRDIPSNLDTLLQNEFRFLMRLHISNNQFYSPHFLHPFYEQFQVILKKHHKILTCPEYLSAYCILKLTQMNAAFYLAQIACENSLTLYWAHKVNQLIGDLRDYSSEIWYEPKLNALFVLAMAHVYQGWNKEAYILLKKAFNLLNFTYHSAYIIKCIENMIASLNATLLYTEEAIQVLTQCCLILEEYQKALKKIFELQGISEVSSDVDIILLKAKETLTKIQICFFINSPLINELKQLGMHFQGFQDQDMLLILDQSKISLEHGSLKVCLNTLPSSIQYDPSCKGFLFKLDSMPMRNITWLRNFKNLLLEIQQSTERALIQDFSSLTIESTPLEPKVKIKTRPLQTTCEGDPEPEGNSEPESKEESYGFNLVPGYSPPVPIVCKNKYIPEETLFLFMPTNDPNFLPFLNLIRDKESGKYHGVYSIDPKGHKQQGVKFAKGMEMARLKVLGPNGKGKLRAIGEVCQEYTTKEGRKRKLYGIKEVENKKSEKHKNLLK